MLLYDLVDMQELQGFVREYQAEIERDVFTLSRFLPNNNIDDIEYRVTRQRRQDQDAATIRAWDTESPIAARRAQYERLMGELPPISRKIRLGEEERLRRRSLERNNNDGLVNAVYDDAGNMARAVTARVELLRGEALATAALNINENGVVQTVNFGRDAALTVTAGTIWSNPAATIVTDLVNWLRTYSELNDGARPGRILASDEIMGNLLFNTQIRQLAQGRDTLAPMMVSQTNVANVFQAYGIPPFESYETHVRIAGVRTRVLPRHSIIMVPPNARDLGETLSGTTAEALELVGARQLEADQAPGLTAVVEKTFDPVATWTKAAAISLPVLWDANLTMRANVLTP